MTLTRRLIALLASTTVGASIGVVGHALTGDPWWALAVPVCVAAAWFLVADPTRCTPERPPASRRPR